MPRIRKSADPLHAIVQFFMTAALSAASAALTTAQAIVATRRATGLQDVALPLGGGGVGAGSNGSNGAGKPRRVRGPAKPKAVPLPLQAVEGMPEGTATQTPAEAPPRRKRGRPAHPKPAAAPPSDLAAARGPRGTNPLPPQEGPAGEPLED